MQDQAITFSEFEELYKPQNYKFVGLKNSDGGDLIKFNQPKDSGAERVKQIGTRLKSKALPDGYYIIECKNSLQKSVLADKYIIQKGDPASAELPNTINIHHAVGQNVNPTKQYTFDQAVAMELDGKKMELEIENLVRANNELADNYELLQERYDRLAEEQQQTLDDSGKNDVMKFIEGTVTNLTPLADRAFDLFEKKINLEAVRLASAHPNIINNNDDDLQEPVRDYEAMTDQQKAELTPEMVNQIKVEWLTSLQYTDPERFVHIQQNGYDG